MLEAFCIASGQVEFFDLGRTPIYRETFAMEDTKRNRRDIDNRSSAYCGMPAGLPAEMH